MNIFHELGIRSRENRINEEVIYNIARVYSVIDSAITLLLSPYGLSTAKFNILLLVKHVHEGKGIAQNEISQLLFVTTSNITRMIDKLENEGFVVRQAQEDDRRVNLIKITKKGSDILDVIWPHYKEIIDRIFSQDFRENEKKTMNESLEKLRTGAEETIIKERGKI